MTLKKTLKTIYHATAPLHVSRSHMTMIVAKQILTDFTPDPSTTCVANNILNLQYDLQIIIPAYNAEKYINECLESVLIQSTHYSYLVTVVNDGSTDHTLDITRSYQEKYPDQIEVINQENQGLSGARNAALRILKGRYVTFLDADDIMTEGAIEALLDKADDKDIIQGGWYTFTQSGGNTPQDAHRLSGYPWGKLFKADVLEHFQFPEGYWFEDTPISFILYRVGYSSKVIPDVVYGYRLNPDGITAKSSGSRRSVESYYITTLCLREFPLFGVKYDQQAYEYFLCQCIMNWSRTKNQPKNVREAIFVLESTLLDKYFKDQHSEMNEDIEKALRKKQFQKYEVLARTK